MKQRRAGDDIDAELNVLTVIFLDFKKVEDVTRHRQNTAKSEKI